MVYYRCLKFEKSNQGVYRNFQFKKLEFIFLSLLSLSSLLISFHSFFLHPCELF